MITVNNLANHWFYTNLLIEWPLVCRTITNFVELVTFGLFVTGVKLQLNIIDLAVYYHLSTRVCGSTSAHIWLALDKGSYTHDNPYFVEYATVFFFVFFFITTVVALSILPILTVPYILTLSLILWLHHRLVGRWNISIIESWVSKLRVHILRACRIWTFCKYPFTVISNYQLWMTFKLTACAH